MAGTDGLAPPSADAPVLRLSPGSTVPGTRYRIVRWLGEGGMGVVYEAEHLDIERRVAFKILRFDLSRQPRMAQVFRDEARAASKLGSTNIVDIYDFGELPDGRLFFCMELLEGRDLVPASEEDTLEPGVLIGVLRQVCKGLHAAHRCGVVHRDIKPENIITVTRDGREGVVKIVDFGISAMLSAGKDSGGGVAGTPHYMAPEQITGAAFDGRLDIYSVGVMAYELLVGRPPFDADELEPLLRMHLTEPPPPPSKVRPDKSVPKALEQVILRCLAKAPGDRYADMADLEAALCEAQIADGLHTPWDDLPLPELDDLDRKERLLRDMPSPLAEYEVPRRRWLWPAVAAVSMAVALGLAAFVYLRQPTEEQRVVVQELVSKAQDAAARSRWVFPTEDDPDAPTALRTVLDLEKVEGPAEDLADEEAAKLRKTFAQTLFDQGAKLWEIPGARAMAREYYGWGVLFDDSDPVAFQRSGLTYGALADMRERLASGQSTDAERAMATLLAAASETDEARRRELEASLQDMADADALGMTAQMVLADAAKATNVKLRRRRRPKDGVEPGEAAAAADPPPPPEPAGDTDGEAPAPEEVTKRRKLRKRDVDAMLGRSKRDPKRAASLADEGYAALRAGRRKEAESLFNQAVAFDRRNARALMGLSDVYFDLGQNQKAVQYAERAVKASPRNRGYRVKLGDVYFKVLRYRDALEQYEEAKKLGHPKASARIQKVKAKLGG